MNQSRKLKLFLFNSQVKPQVVSQAPSIQANIKGHRKEDGNSVYFIDFNTDNLHHWEKNLTHLCYFSIPFSRADIVIRQERSVALHTRGSAQEQLERE